MSTLIPSEPRSEHAAVEVHALDKRQNVFSLSAFRNIALVCACLAIFSSLLPVWLPSTLPPSCDGPSHVYNAMIANSVMRGTPAFTKIYQLRQWPRSNFLTDSALRFFGARFGWIAAERIWLTIVLGLQFFAFLYVFTPLSAPWRIMLALILANNWFLWMGFYDFALSLAAFVGLITALRAPPSRKSNAWVLLALLGLYATHLFTMTIGLGLATLVLSWRAFRSEVRPAWLGSLLLPWSLFALELFGPSVHGGIGWWGWWKVLKNCAGLFCGDSLLTFSWVGIPAAFLFIFLVWLGASSLWLRRSRMTQAELVLGTLGLCILVFSVAAPPQAGAGTHISARLRLMGELTILICTGRAMSSLPAATILERPIFSIVLGLAFVLQSAAAVQAGKAVSQEVTTLNDFAMRAGVSHTDWLAARMWQDRRRVFRIVPFWHLPDRICLERDLRGLDNYEAMMNNFQVQWRSSVSDVVVRQDSKHWQMIGIPQFVAKDVRPLWVFHDSNVPIQVRPGGYRTLASYNGADVTLEEIKPAD